MTIRRTARRKVTAAEQRYIDSESWKCTRSPTGAHYWKQLGNGDNPKASWRCVYCKAVRHPKPGYMWPSFTTSEVTPWRHDGARFSKRSA